MAIKMLVKLMAGLGGFALLWHIDPKVCIGVLLVMWAHNILHTY